MLGDAIKAAAGLAFIGQGLFAEDWQTRFHRKRDRLFVHVIGQSDDDTIECRLCLRPAQDLSKTVVINRKGWIKLAQFSRGSTGNINNGRCRAPTESFKRGNVQLPRDRTAAQNQQSRY